jgi:hypothetical protein
MTLQTIAIRALHSQPGLMLSRERQDQIAERFRLVYCENESEWNREDDCVYLFNGTYALRELAVRIRYHYYHLDSVEQCLHCNEHDLPQNFVNVYSGSRERLWCSTCACDDAAECCGCSYTFNREEMQYDERSEEWYCSECQPEARNIFGYHSQRRPSISYDDREFPFWSIELEMEFRTNQLRSSFVDELRENKYIVQNNIICETDGSLDHDMGIEVIFSLYRNKGSIMQDVATVQALARKHNAIAWDLYRKRGRNAGLHVNRNREGWKPHELMRLTYLVERLKLQLITLAGRDCTSYAAFSNGVLYGSPRRLLRLSQGHQGKYAALNLSCHSRIEWRLFSATLSAKRLQAYLDTVEILEQAARSSCPVKGLLASVHPQIISILNRFN